MLVMTARLVVERCVSISNVDVPTHRSFRSCGKKNLHPVCFVESLAAHICSVHNIVVVHKCGELYKLWIDTYVYMCVCGDMYTYCEYIDHMFLTYKYEKATT